MNDLQTLPPAAPAFALSPDVQSRTARQGTGSSPVPSAFTDAIMASVSRSPAQPGSGGGPSGYSTGAVTNRGILPSGAGNPTGAYHRPLGTFFPGSGVYAPPSFPPGSGYPAGSSGSAYAPSDGPYLVSVMDSRLPNATLASALVTLLQDKSYIFTQAIPASSWVITHNFGKYPSVSCADSAGSEVYGDVAYTTINQVTITFSAPFAGTAYLN